MKRKLLRYSLLGLLAVVVLIAGAVLWALNTRTGARVVFSFAEFVTGYALQIGTVDGSISGPLELTNLRYRNPAAGIEVSAQNISVEVELPALLRRRLHVATAQTSGVRVNLSEAAPHSSAPSKPLSIDPPIDIEIDEFLLSDAQIQRDGQLLVAIDRAHLVGEWSHTAIVIERLDVRSPDGEIHFVADLSGRPTPVGEGHGEFRWKIGEQSVAGTLSATARAPYAEAKIALTSPVAAHLDVTVEQRDDHPWQLTLDVPAFDPRDGVLPDSDLQQLSVSLHGSGSTSEALLSGRVHVNEVPVTIERMNLVPRGDDIGIDGAVRLEQGLFTLSGQVHRKAEPVAATVALDWKDVVLPAQLVGQPLASNGHMTFDGSAQGYAANGTLQLGPQDKLADIQLKLQGSPDRIHLQQLHVTQPAGLLSLAGRVDLQPALSWKLDALARHFDPGAFAAAWTGDLSFKLASSGRIHEAGPQGTFTLTDLKGRLRNRELTGFANLELLPRKVLAGTMDVRSGNSRLQVRGDGGNAMNVVALIDVPSLKDWIPESAGSAHGRITARGKWPELELAGSAHGNSLRLAQTSVDSLSLEFDVLNPTAPRGRAQIDVRKAASAGFEFSALTVQVSGDPNEYRVDAHAAGVPLGAELLVRGGRTDQEWSASVERLILDVKDAARLQLQQPAKVRYAKNAASISDACFADGTIRLCMQGSTQATGAFDARYLLQSVPLELANVFVANLPVSFHGSFDGAGTLSRNDRGDLAGDAHIGSASGSMTRKSDVADDAPTVLLTYSGLNLQATLNGRDADARIEARLNDTGSVEGRVHLSQRQAAATTIRGDVNANLPNLQFIELFAPQLSNVQGELTLRAGISGRLAEPAVSGELQAANLAIEIPTIGLKLRNGTISVASKPSNESPSRLALQGRISSGNGEMAFDGTAAADGTVQVKTQGENFLAADLPGARVAVNPDLTFTRSAQKMHLEGKVVIASAAIDMQKLPRGRRTQNASPDVVVIDAADRDEQRTEAIPLTAAINVALGDDVSLTGFGLQATVAGQLEVREVPGTPTTGSGELRVAGTYQAYGQDLTIRQGQLLYASTALDNPRLNIVAVREIEDVTAGLRVTGSAQAPQLAVFSEPAMGQSNALAYLVTGKPLERIGENSGDGDALQSAARSLGTAAGGLLAKNVGRRIGVDELGIQESEAIGGAALTVGQYLSPRLYLSYGVGLFQPGEVLTLRYKLSSSLSLEVLNGTSGSRAGIEFRKER